MRIFNLCTLRIGLVSTGKNTLKMSLSRLLRKKEPLVANPNKNYLKIPASTRASILVDRWDFSFKCIFDASRDIDAT